MIEIFTNVLSNFVHVFPWEIRQKKNSLPPVYMQDVMVADFIFILKNM